MVVPGGTALYGLRREMLMMLLKGCAGSRLMSFRKEAMSWNTCLPTGMGRSVVRLSKGKGQGKEECGELDI